MRFISWGILGFIILEIISIAMVSAWIGGGWTLLIMALSIIWGLFMLRHVGVSGVLIAMSTLRNGQYISLYQKLWPIRYILASLLFISPGFFSDIIAIIILLPIKGKLLNNGFNTHTFYSSKNESNQEDIIEGEYTVYDDSQSESTHNPRLPPK